MSSDFHALLLLSDSALPLGSFAFSSGLESFLAHNKHTNAANKLQAFEYFLQNSLSNITSTSLAYVRTGYYSPRDLEQLDNDFDASTPCTVARRASVAQGKALITIWERALCTSAATHGNAVQAAEALNAFTIALKTSKPDAYGLQLNGHFPPIFGAVCTAVGLRETDATYLFLLNHAKTLLSAAVRASVLGPYQSQAILASEKLRGWIRGCLAKDGLGKTEGAAVTVPTMDLWMGRHELLYSRIFNS